MKEDVECLDPLGASIGPYTLGQVLQAVGLGARLADDHDAA